MRPPRTIVLYADERGRSDVAVALAGLETRLRRRVFEKLAFLEAQDWAALFKQQLVKELKGADGIYELRTAGLRLSFFVTGCRGRNEVVLTELERRADLVGGFWERFIERAERRRDDWVRRNCRGSDDVPVRAVRPAF